MCGSIDGSQTNRPFLPLPRYVMPCLYYLLRCDVWESKCVMNWFSGPGLSSDPDLHYCAKYMQPLCMRRQVHKSVCWENWSTAYFLCQGDHPLLNQALCLAIKQQARQKRVFHHTCIRAGDGQPRYLVHWLMEHCTKRLLCLCWGWGKGAYKTKAGMGCSHHATNCEGMINQHSCIRDWAWESVWQVLSD